MGPINIRKFNRDSTLQRILPTRISNTDRKPSANRRLPSKTSLQSRPRLRSRTKIQTTISPSTTFTSFTNVQEETNPDTTIGETVLTEIDIMDKLGLTVVRTEQPDTTIDMEELEVKGIVDIVHDGESLTTSENEVLPTQSPFQVLIDANESNDESDDHDDHVHDIVHEHHPEIHFRHLKPDLLPEEPRLSTEEMGSGVTIDISDILEEAHAAANEMFLPTTLPPSVIPVEITETKENVPATAQAFLPTVDQAPTGGFLPTVSRTSSRFRGSSRKNTATEASSPSRSSSRRDKLKFRRRNRDRVESDVSSTQETETAKPKGNVSAPRTPTRTRTRTRNRTRSRVANTKQEESQTEGEEKTEQKSVPSRRITNPRRLVSRTKTNSAPVFKSNTVRPRTSFRNNQRLRVRGGGRRSTEAPEVSEITDITERQVVVSSTVKNDFEVETEKSLEDSESVTTTQPLSQTSTQFHSTLTTTTPSNLFSSKPSSSKSSSSKILSSPTKKRFPFRSGSKKSSLSNLFNRRNKHKKSPILSRLSTTTSPSEETTLTSAQEEKSSQGGEDVNTDESSTPFRPTVPDILISTDASTPAPFFPTFVPVNSATDIPEKPQTTPGPVILITKGPQEQPRRDSPRKLEIFNLQNELTDNKSFDQDTVRLGSKDDDDKSISREQSLFKEVQDNIRSSEVPQRSSRPFVGRPLRPVPSRNQDASSRQRSSSRQHSRSRSRAPIAATSPKPTTRFETNFEPSEPEQPASPVQSSRVLSAEDLVQALVPAATPATRIARPQVTQPRRKEPEPQAKIPIRQARPQVNPFDKIVPQKSTPSRNRNLVRPEAPASPLGPVSNTEFEYEYYYDYLDDDHDKPNTDYDLVPLANKVRILSDGLPHCLDVGVFPHPFSCKKFVNCFRNPGTGIVGSIYQCPSYLAFDPVGGRCNWVNEIVCASRK